MTSDDVLRSDTMPVERHRDRRGRGRRGVRLDVPRPRREGHRARVPARDRPARGPRRQQGAGADLQPARDQGHHQRPLRRRRRSRPTTTASTSRSAPRARTRGARAPTCCWSPRAAPSTPRTSASRRPSAEVDRGIVKVDGHMRTREPHLYAIGDIVGGLMLAHTAAHEGITAVHTIAGDPDVHAMDYVEQPRATYCRPEIASVGLTEQQCEERGLPIKVGKVPFQAIAKALIGGEYEGFTKIIAQQGDRRDARDPHHRPARHGPDRRGAARADPRGDARGRSASRPTRTRRSRRSSARPRWRSTAGASTSSAGRAAGTAGGPIPARSG